MKEAALTSATPESGPSATVIADVTDATTADSSAVVAGLGAVYAYVLVYLGYAYFYFYGFPHAGGL